MLCWMLFAFLVANVTADEETVRLGDKWTTFMFGNSSHPLKNNKRWILTSEPGTTIKVFFNDFRLPYAPPESCNYGKVVFDDGYSQVEKCESNYGLEVKGKSSRLIVDLIMKPNMMGMFHGLAKAVSYAKDEETVMLSPGTGVTKISFPAREEDRGQDRDKAWRFISTTSDKISLQCSIGMEGPSETGCARDIFTVDKGDGPKVYCAGNDIVVISEGREIKMRIELFPGTTGHANCVAQAITGPNPNEHNNVKYPDDDSSEYGVVPGRKTTTCECGKANKEDGRIINGTESREGKYPFMVSMRGTGDGHFCGGSIITPVHILTAAHCVSDRKTKNEPVPSELMPTVGVHLTSADASHGETQRLKVKEVFIPPLWFAVKGSLAGDIALLHLENPIKFSKWVSPVCLTPTQPPIINKFIKAMGWGYTENGYPDKMMESRVQVLDNALCNQNPKETCFKTRPSTTCFGDSGGPYVYVDPETNRYTQVSLVSYVYGECNGAYYIGTNVVYWYKWIQENIEASTKDYAICLKSN